MDYLSFSFHTEIRKGSYANSVFFMAEWVVGCFIDIGGIVDCFIDIGGIVDCFIDIGGIVDHHFKLSFHNVTFL
jgi:hypothetical protein